MKLLDVKSVTVVSSLVLRSHEVLQNGTAVMEYATHLRVEDKPGVKNYYFGSFFDNLTDAMHDFKERGLKYET